ncbi:hypothetical protein BH11MYX1_BH11MYX1_05270 [soil metagenome]
MLASGFTAFVQAGVAFGSIGIAKGGSQTVSLTEIGLATNAGLGCSF